MKIWSEKYKPESIEDIPQLQATLIARDLIKKKKPIILHGQTGCGKTSLAYALAKELDYEILEVNASDIRDKESILNIVGESLRQECLFKKDKLILIDEIDNVNSSDRGGISAIVSLIPEITCPVVLTAIDIENEKIKPLKNKCNSIPLIKISSDKIIKILTNIAESEKIEYNKDLLETIATKTNGDIRAAINDLQVYTTFSLVDNELVSRDNEDTIPIMLKKVFRTENLLDAAIAIDNTAIDLDESILWLEENIPIEYKTKREVSNAFNYLSRADVFIGRIRRRQNWGFLVYEKYLMSSGINNSKLYSDNLPTRYKRNSRILKIWIHNQKYGLKKEIAKKLAPHIKTSTKSIIKSFPIYKKILKNTNIAKRIKLTDEEIFFVYN